MGAIEEIRERLADNNKPFPLEVGKVSIMHKNDITMSDIIDELDHVDDPDVLERIKAHPALLDALQIMRRPQNWWGIGMNPQMLFDLAKADGIPVMYIPSTAILRKLATTTDRTARMAVLMLHQEEILNDCKELVSDGDDISWLPEQYRLTDEYGLIQKAFAAYEAGHHEAATALAVAVCDALARSLTKSGGQPLLSQDDWADDDKWGDKSYEKWEKRLKEYVKKNRKKYEGYNRATWELSADHDNFFRPLDWHDKALIAPILRFFTSWHPEDGTPPPTHLSRHVVAHQPTLAHFSKENALLALMLVTSLICEAKARVEALSPEDFYPELASTPYNP